MKQKLLNSLGFAGNIIWIAISAFIGIAPLIAIGAGFFLNLLFLAIAQFVPATSIVFWIWGLIVTIKGTQDIFAIIYYVVFALLFVPYYIAIVLDIAELFRKK